MRDGSNLFSLGKGRATWFSTCIKAQTLCIDACRRTEQLGLQTLTHRKVCVMDL